MLMKKRMLTGLLSTLVITALAGCGGNAATQAPGVTQAPEIQKPAEQKPTEPAKTEEAATEKGLEGELTIYTSQPEADIQALVEAFNKRQPDIQVNIFRSGTEEVVSKILAEKQANAVQADVLLVSDTATFETLKSEDLLLSYQSPELEGIDASYYDKDNTYTGTKIISTGIIVNRDTVKEEIAGFKDLLKEEYKDQLIMPSPLYSGAAAYNLGVLTRTEGIGWEFYEALKQNGVTVDKGNGAVQKAVVSGQNGLGIIVDYMAIRAQKDGAPVEFIYPEEGSLIVTEPVGITKESKNQEMAKAFVDFILSDEGQEKTAEIGYTPIKSGVKAPEGFRGADEITNLTYDIQVLVETRESDKEKFSELFQ